MQHQTLPRLAERAEIRSTALLGERAGGPPTGILKQPAPRTMGRLAKSKAPQHWTACAEVEVQWSRAASLNRASIKADDLLEQSQLRVPLTGTPEPLTFKRGHPRGAGARRSGRGAEAVEEQVQLGGIVVVEIRVGGQARSREPERMDWRAGSKRRA